MAETNGNGNGQKVSLSLLIDKYSGKRFFAFLSSLALIGMILVANIFLKANIEITWGWIISGLFIAYIGGQSWTDKTAIPKVEEKKQ